MLAYTIKRHKRAKYLKLRIESDGSVSVTAPFGIPTFLVKQFVNRSEDWIVRQKKRLTLKKSAYPTIDWEATTMSILGKLYKIAFDPNGQDRVTVGRGYIYVTPITGFEAHIKRTLLAWLKRFGCDFIEQQTKKWSIKMKTDYGEIQFGQQKSRWGSCSSANNLRFNWRLIHFPTEIIDYVVIHELAHTIEHNHSKSFWALVARFDPGYKEHMRFLKTQVIELEKA